MSVPEDKYNLVYILYIMHGIGMLMPWHSTIKGFEFLRDLYVKKTTNYYKYLLGIGTILPRIIFVVINMFVPKSYWTFSSRILVSLAVQSLVMAFIVLITLSNVEDFPTVYSWMTIVSNIVMSATGGIYMSSGFGSAAIMPMKYTNALCIGLSLESTLVLLFDTIYKAMKPVPKLMAVVFFMIAVVIHIVCIVLEMTLKSNKFRVYYQNLSENKRKLKTKETDIKRNRYLYVLTQTSEQLLDLFLTLFVTFTITPGIISKVVLIDNWFHPDYNTLPFTFFVNFAFFLFGTIFAKYFQYPRPESMIAFTSALLLFIPFALFFNYKPKERYLPVLFKSDLLFIAFIAIQGITCGHLFALSLMYAPKQVPQQYSHIAGMMNVLMFAIAAMFGYIFSLFLENIV